MIKKYSKKEIVGFMRETSLMSLAISEDNQPSSYTMLFAVDDDFSLYFGTLKDSYKARTLQKNNKVGFSIWEDRKMLIQAHGEVELLEGNEIVKALDKIVDAAASLPEFWPPVLQIKGHDYVVYKINPKWLRVLDLSSDVMVENENMFMEVEL